MLIKLNNARLLELAERMHTVMNQGGIVLLPFDVGYALLCETGEGLDRILKMKKRPSDRPPVILGTPEIFKELTIASDSEYQAIKDINLPVGLIAKTNTKSPYFKLIPEKLIHKRTIGVFINMGELGDAIATYAFQKKRLSFGSSANISGEGNHYLLQDVEPEIRKSVNLEINGEETKYQEFKNNKGLGSTIIDLMQRRITRQGLLYSQIKEKAKKLLIA